MPLRPEQRAKAGPYCLYCTNPQGELKPREAVREGLVHVFMRGQRLERPKAERLVESHLARMPAWAGTRAPAARAAHVTATEVAKKPAKAAKRAKRKGAR